MTETTEKLLLNAKAKYNSILAFQILEIWERHFAFTTSNKHAHYWERTQGLLWFHKAQASKFPDLAPSKFGNLCLAQVMFTRNLNVLQKKDYGTEK